MLIESLEEGGGAIIPSVPWKNLYFKEITFKRFFAPKCLSIPKLLKFWIKNISLYFRLCFHNLKKYLLLPHRRSGAR